MLSQLEAMRSNRLRHAEAILAEAGARLIQAKKLSVRAALIRDHFSELPNDELFPPDLSSKTRHLLLYKFSLARVYARQFELLAKARMQDADRRYYQARLKFGRQSKEFETVKFIVANKRRDEYLIRDAREEADSDDYAVGIRAAFTGR